MGLDHLLSKGKCPIDPQNDFGAGRDTELALSCGPIAQLVEHRADNAGVTGAIPVRPTIPYWWCAPNQRYQTAALEFRSLRQPLDRFPIWACSSAGRAPDLHSGGQRFDPAQVHQYLERLAIAKPIYLGPVRGLRGWFFDNCMCLAEKFSVIKLLRADGGCLGFERR